MKINLSQAFAGQKVGVKQVEEKTWLVSFMRYHLGFFDHETCRIESAENLTWFTESTDRTRGCSSPGAPSHRSG